jgi:hypothetical protein
MVIPNPLEIATNLACPQTPNTGGFETSSGSAPPLLGATALGGFPDLKQVAWAGGRFGKIHIIDFGIWYYVGMKDQESHAALATQLSTASNPETAPEILRELSQHELIEVRQAVAMNPNTPIEILWELLPLFPDKIIENPIFSLLILENPNWIQTIPESYLAAVLQQSDPPEMIVLAALKYKDDFGTASSIQVLAANQVAKKPHIPVEVLEEIVLEHKVLYSWIIENPKIQINSFKRFARMNDRGFQGDLISFCLDEDFETGFLWPQHLEWTDTIEAVIPLLVENAVDDIIRDDLLTRANLPLKYIPTLIRNLSDGSLFQLAKSKRTSSRVLAGLADCQAEDTNWQIRILQAIAKHPQTPISAIEKLVRSEYKAVRAHIANRLDLPLEILIQLLTDSYPKVRKNLLNNPHVATATLTELSIHSDPQIREFVQIYRSQNP